MEHIIWEVHQPEKDETDTELALNRAMASGCGEIAVLGATGGRLDHMLGNIHLLYPCLQKGFSPIFWIPRIKCIFWMKEKTFLKKHCGESTSPSCR